MEEVVLISYAAPKLSEDEGLQKISIVRILRGFQDILLQMSDHSVQIIQ